MGAAKEALMQAQYQQEVATDIAVRAGVLERCPYHGVVFDPLNGDNGKAYALGNLMFNNGNSVIPLELGKN